MRRRIFWNPIWQEWMPIIACGDLGVEGWYQLMKRCGLCVGTIKR